MCDAPHFCTLQTHVKLAWDISVHKAQGKLHVCNVWVMVRFYLSWFFIPAF